jgi:hypothetical protein
LGAYIYSGDDLPESDAPANMGELFKKEDDVAYAKTLAKIAPKTTMGELTKKEDGPKYEAITKKLVPNQPTTWDPSDESRKLFTEGMIEWTSDCTTVAGLNSYWISNELQLKSLKVTHPPLVEEILNRFKTLKLQLSKETK